MSFKTSYRDWVRIYLFATSALFGVLGTSFIGQGIYYLTLKEEAQLKGLSEAKTNRASGINMVFSGCLSLIAGIVGFVVMFVKLRWSLIAWGVMLFVALIVSMTSLVSINIGVNRSDVLNEVRELIKTSYGNDNSSPYNQEFTESLDAYQATQSCCGWSDNGISNIFVTSPWFRHANQRSKPDSLLMVPESCCASKAVGTHRNYCIYAKDLEVARNNGHVHSEDCVRQILKTKPLHVLAIALYTISVVSKITCIFLVVWMVTSDHNRDSVLSTASSKSKDSNKELTGKKSGRQTQSPVKPPHSHSHLHE